MKQFTNVRELIGQIGLDLGAKAGKFSSAFRANIREELEGFGAKENVTISVKQTANGSLVTLNIEDWVERQEQTRIKQQFKNLMNRLGASSTGVCCGTIPGNLVAYLNQGGR